MGWTTPTTRSTGDLITASIWNTDVVEDLKYLHGDGGVFALASGGLIQFGSDATANLKRDSASTVKTDGTFVAGVGVIISSNNLYIGASAGSGGGSGLISLYDVVTPPSTTQSGGFLYSQSGALKWRGGSGTVTTIAVA